VVFEPVEVGRAGLIGLTLTLLLVQGGCATARPEPAPLPPELRTQLGRVGVVAARFAPALEATRPRTGKLRWAALGFLLGGPLYALIGAGSAEWADRAQKAEAALQHAFAELEIQQTLRDRLVALARDEARLDVGPGGDVGPARPEEATDYRRLAAEGIDTVLEVSVTRLGLVTREEAPNPRLALTMTTRVRLVRSGDGAELYREELSHRSGFQKFVEWAARDAQAFRGDLDRLHEPSAGDHPARASSSPGTIAPPHADAARPGAEPVGGPAQRLEDRAHRRAGRDGPLPADREGLTARHLHAPAGVGAHLRGRRPVRPRRAAEMIGFHVKQAPQ
jgi:hypothetical protein